MNVKKFLRTVVVPVVAGSVAAVVAILLSRPSTSVTIDPDYDVPTDVDEPPFHVEINQPEETVTTTVTRPRKPKTV